MDPQQPEHVARWRHWALCKLGLMDAAWKDAAHGIHQVRPDFLVLTQSVCGWTAHTDGYYFNVARSLPITSGHGGYDDIGCGYCFPGFVLEMARARDRWKPCWYLPTWYGGMLADRLRLEQYLSFQTHLHGRIPPPDNDPFEPETTPAAQGIVEANRGLGRLGCIFHAMPPERPHVAMLYALSNVIHRQTQDRKINYAHEVPHFQGLVLSYLACKLIQQPIWPLLEEDVLDGSLEAHRVLLLPSLDYVDPAVLGVLERFVEQGGTVLMTADCGIALRGVRRLNVAPAMPDQETIDRLLAERRYDQLGPYTTVGRYLEGARPLAAELRRVLNELGIWPVVETDLPTLSATRHAAGDLEYLFLVNATYDEAAGGRHDIRAAQARISLPDDGRPVYDALRGGPAQEFSPAAGRLTAHIRFGAGQMRVLARTARPLGALAAGVPQVVRDTLAPHQPLRLELSFAVLDSQHGLVSGAVPLVVRVIDPLGTVRHELVRSTRQGTLQLTLPLAANDPAGRWRVQAEELLAGHAVERQFDLAPWRHPAAAAGELPRAVYFGDELRHICRFVRTFDRVSIVAGRSAFNEPAARRLAEALAAWGVHCRHVPLESAARSRTLSEEEARTWVGLSDAPSGAIKPGDANPPELVGFAVNGPVILLGNPQDNPLIAFLAQLRFLPYQTDAAIYPGPGRGDLAWQRDGIGRNQESITLIAYDEQGMHEAVGTCYEAKAKLGEVGVGDRECTKQSARATRPRPASNH